MAISPGKKEPYEPRYVRYGKESGVCSEYGRKPVKGAQALCYMLQIRKFPEGRGEVRIHCSPHFSGFIFLLCQILVHKILDALVPFQCLKYLEFYFVLVFIQFDSYSQLVVALIQANLKQESSLTFSEDYFIVSLVISSLSHLLISFILSTDDFD